jgi:DNA-binding response OmpR family regulator
VLVVEDDPDLGQMMALALRRTDMQVVAARDGIQAVEEARRFDPHVAVIDLGLPHLGGHALGRQLRTLRSDTDLPFLVAVTGDSRESTRQASVEAGFALHLVKPVQPKDLAERIRELVG